MATPVAIPKLGNPVEECLISRWVKRKGDTVSAGELVAEIETDKATFEVTAPVDGVVLDTFFDEGALVPVFTNLFVIGAPGESAEGFRPGGRVEPAVEAVAVAPISGDRSVDAAGTSPCATTSTKMSPRARRFARDKK